jgi:type I restriction enzyme S subunit
LDKPYLNKWFIEEPKDEWDKKQLDEIATFLNGLALQKYPAKEREEFLPVIKIKELREGITAQSNKANLDLPEDYIIQNGDVLFSWSGSLEVVIWTDGKGALNQHFSR